MTVQSEPAFAIKNNGPGVGRIVVIVQQPADAVSQLEDLMPPCLHRRRVRGHGSRPGTLGAEGPGRPVRWQAFRFARNEALAYVAAFAPVLPAFLLLCPLCALRFPIWSGQRRGC
ncbi:hypothetical protein GGP96_003238 [Salinibacter ruber]|uniref:Uncharacterized protein n=1 Tax=Salinibacter ruber TaxID=146919 RepID=A0A9X2U3V0_9BACT|nr:hypothetical protein [Salinibacter ruber]MCS3866375.1 hypothetical protein [Salinibacter ruber]MCS4151695.1 hypothetical protein [Salinibacter ruber]MCS4178489.1 hypothetical protein [Salinibacter ruber]